MDTALEIPGIARLVTGPGGLPVIFPWFGPRQGHSEAPVHGFVRTRSRTAESIRQHPGGKVVITLRLEPDAETRALWGEPHDWVFRHRITVGAALTMELEIENRGAPPSRCEEALHTYWPSMVCVETGNLADTRRKSPPAPGGSRKQSCAARRFKNEGGCHVATQ